MLIEYELQGSFGEHKGLFDTNGFWVRFEEDKELESGFIYGYKIYSHCSFSYFNKDKYKTQTVYRGLINTLAGVDFLHPDLGYIKEII